MNQWPTGHVQTQQSMGSCLLYNKSMANWACADTTIHGLISAHGSFLVRECQEWGGGGTDMASWP